MKYPITSTIDLKVNVRVNDVIYCAVNDKYPQRARNGPSWIMRRLTNQQVFVQIWACVSKKLGRVQ